MASNHDADMAAKLRDAIVAFAAEGRFPDSDDVSSISLSNADLGPAIDALTQARADLEVFRSAYWKPRFSSDASFLDRDQADNGGDGSRMQRMGCHGPISSR